MRKVKIELVLYRMKIYPSRQQTIISKAVKKGKDELFWSLLEDKTSKELRKGQMWHIGNIEKLDQEGGVFAIGKTTKSTIELYDEDAGNFVVEDYSSSPYTFVYFDAYIGLVAIAKKPKLASKVGSIAKNLCQLLNGSKTSIDYDLKIDIALVSNPMDFLKSLRSAYRISSFEFSFARPNPFDAEEYIHRPNQKYLECAGGDSGKTSIRGDTLNADTLTEVTKSVASTGESVKAKIQESKGKPETRIDLAGNPVIVPSIEYEKTPAELLKAVRDAYSKIRE